MCAKLTSMLIVGTANFFAKHFGLVGPNQKTANYHIACSSTLPNSAPSPIPCPVLAVFAALSACLFASAVLPCSVVLSSHMGVLRTVPCCLLWTRCGSWEGFTIHFCLLTSGRGLPAARILHLKSRFCLVLTKCLVLLKFSLNWIKI